VRYPRPILALPVEELIIEVNLLVRDPIAKQRILNDLQDLRGAKGEKVQKESTRRVLIRSRSESGPSPQGTCSEAAPPKTRRCRKFQSFFLDQHTNPAKASMHLVKTEEGSTAENGHRVQELGSPGVRDSG